MRGLIFGIAGLLLASPVFCQVDTLMLVEIGSIEAPAEITNLYIEDLDGDSLKEIILTTATNVHIYNGITYEPIWTSPELANPQDLLFEDINLDGLIDFSVKDTTNIHLFDPHNDTVIWTSPAIDSTHKCYTIGDRNDDDWIDVAIVSKEWFTRPRDRDNMDTVWTKIYDGPDFYINSEFTILMPNVSNPFDLSTRPVGIRIHKIFGETGLATTICLFSHRYYHNEEGPGYSAHRDGYVYLINAQTFLLNNIIDVGRVFFSGIQEYNGVPELIVLGNRRFDHGDGYDDIRELSILSADTMLVSHEIQSYTYFWPWEWGTTWHGFVIDDILSINQGDEIIIGRIDVVSQDATLSGYSFPDYQSIRDYDINDNLDSMSFVIRDYDIFDNPQILFNNLYPDENVYFFDFEYEQITAVLISPVSLNGITDTDNDNKDEIISISNNVLVHYNYRIQPEINLNFIEHELSSYFAMTLSIMSIDLDDDGNQDVLAAGHGQWQGKISWFENLGNGNFVERVIDDNFNRANSVYAADIDSDGDLDVIGTARAADEVAWWENNGEEYFEKHLVASGQPYPISCIAGDIDSDNDIDIIASLFSGNRVVIYENNGQQEFNEYIVDDNFDGAFSIYIIDMDNDGDLDIAGAAFNDDEIAWWENTGYHDFNKETIAIDFDGAHSVFACDMDNDNDIDVLGAAYNGNSISWWENDGNQDFRMHPISTSFNGAYSAYADDLNNDGFIDVMGVANTSGSILAWINDGYENFSIINISSNYNGASCIKTFDADNDGDTDIITASNNTNNRIISWWENDLITTEIYASDDLESSTPYAYFLRSNYPNPFNSSTTIEYGMPEAGPVVIEIYDLLGRKVKTLVDEEQAAGTYQVVWDARDRSSGVYFYRITSGEFTETRRMVLLK